MSKAKKAPVVKPTPGKSLAAVGAIVPAGTPTLELHPLVHFVPGEMSADEFVALCEDIRLHGQHEPIWLYDSMVIDGRHRLKACKKLGIEPKTRVFEGADPMSFVISENLHRRQLNSMQKAIVGARMTLDEKTPVSQEDAAKRLGVGKATLNLACKLLKSNNTPLIKRCEMGEATRAEIDEEMYDRSLANTPAPVNAAGSVNNAETGGEDEDVFGAAPLVGGAPSRVTGGGGAVGTKPTHPERQTVETSPSVLAAKFAKLSKGEQRSFIQLAWHALAPALVEAGKLDKSALPKDEGKGIGAAPKKAPAVKATAKGIKASKAGSTPKAYKK